MRILNTAFAISLLCIHLTTACSNISENPTTDKIGLNLDSKFLSNRSKLDSPKIIEIPILEKRIKLETSLNSLDSNFSVKELGALESIIYFHRTTESNFIDKNYEYVYIHTLIDAVTLSHKQYSHNINGLRYNTYEGMGPTGDNYFLLDGVFSTAGCEFRIEAMINNEGLHSNSISLINLLIKNYGEVILSPNEDGFRHCS